MSEETLFTAARRLVRNLNADFASGLISQETEAAAHTLQVQLEKHRAAETTGAKEEARFYAESRGIGAKDLGFLREGADAEGL